MLVCKALVKHGWPAHWRAAVDPWSFWIVHADHKDFLPPDFSAAVDIAVRIAARTYRVEVICDDGLITFQRRYRLAPGGHFRPEASQ